VINVPGCPPHPDWIVYPVAQILIHGLPSVLAPGWLDSKGRPAATFGALPNCVKCANLPSMGAPWAAFLGDDGCQATQGCKGPITFGDCPARQKNVFDDGTVNNWCSAGSRGPNIAQARHVCQSCIQPDFPDPPASPFYEPASGGSPE
jgi:hydrogenase small subunit